MYNVTLWTFSFFTRLGCFHGRIDQTLSTSHGVEEELCGRQTGEVRVLHEPPAFGTVVVLDEVRKSAVLEPERDSFTFNVLLTHHSNNLQEKKNKTDFGLKKTNINSLTLRS